MMSLRALLQFSAQPNLSVDSPSLPHPHPSFAWNPREETVDAGNFQLSTSETFSVFRFHYAPARANCRAVSRVKICLPPREQSGPTHSMRSSPMDLHLAKPSRWNRSVEPADLKAKAGRTPASNYPACYCPIDPHALTVLSGSYDHVEAAKAAQRDKSWS